jgi:hypothetical protein
MFTWVMISSMISLPTQSISTGVTALMSLPAILKMNIRLLVPHISLKKRGIYTSDLNEAARLGVFLSDMEENVFAKMGSLLCAAPASKR